MLTDVHGDAREVELHGATRIRSYGEVEVEYAAATERSAVIDRGGDALLRIEGAQASRMLLGVVSGRMPETGTPDGIGVRGRAERHTVLTPKGKMVADLVLARSPDGEGGERYQALVPAAALEGLKAHFGRYLPPRFAKVTDRSGEIARLTVCGPDAADAISRVVFGLRVEASELNALEPLGWLEVEIGGDPMRVLRATDLDVPCWDVIVPIGAGAGLWRRLVEAGVAPLGAAAWESLRVEAGTPLYGIDMDDATLPTEAGLEEVAIDHTKGCYTGQEVIVRIRDRGQVARKLRRIHLGEMPTPAPGTELFVEGRDRAAAEVRSAAWSPRFGETVALAYVKRGVWPDGESQPAFRGN